MDEEFYFKIRIICQAFEQGLLELVTRKFMKETTIDDQISALMFLLEINKETK